ncbi:unnamed protein product [Adineta ricciae]|uniref:B box-type domain-containing protein n=1 Tax=Adineta ricciae TaxID=249248 RepID=A0A814CAZ8_ADIRI|nr:unnamed protein product [Adineta ricciae]CAF1020190.1 unnamed protein product [Adineta ricciae]
MASASVETRKKQCAKCNDVKTSGGLFTCDGCQQMFCARHVGEHRQELGTELENAMQEYNCIQEQSNQLTFDRSVLEKIDAWEKRSLDKIKQAAEKVRGDFHRWCRDSHDRIKNECTELGTALASAHNRDDFSESELDKWKKTLNDLKTKLQSITKVSIVEDRQMPINLIKMDHVTSFANTRIRPNIRMSSKAHVPIVKPEFHQVVSNQTEEANTIADTIESSNTSTRHPRNVEAANCKQQ